MRFWFVRTNETQKEAEGTTSGSTPANESFDDDDKPQPPQRKATSG
jgi:hypothetical protein